MDSRIKYSSKIGQKQYRLNPRQIGKIWKILVHREKPNGEHANQQRLPDPLEKIDKGKLLVVEVIAELDRLVENGEKHLSDIFRSILKCISIKSDIDSILLDLLRLAVEKNLLQVCKLLLDFGLDVNTRLYRRRLLIKPVYSCGCRLARPRETIKQSFQGKHECEDFFLKELNTELQADETLLHIASKFGHDEIVALLIQYGADIHSNKDGDRPFHVTRSKKVVEIFLNHGIDINLKNKFEETILIDAICEKNEELAYFLIESGADLSGHDSRELTPFQWAMWYKDLTLARILLERGADVNATNRDGYTSLHMAVNYAKAEFVSLLLEHGADIKARDRYNRTVLDYGGCFTADIVKLLFERKSNVHYRNSSGQTPLFNVAKFGETDSISIILDYGADVNARDALGNTPLHICNGYEAIKFLVDRGAEINAKNKDGVTPLHQVANRSGLSSGLEESARYLLERGADINARCKIDDEIHLDPLHIATNRGSIEVVAVLLDFGADMNSKDAHGSTPLDVAIRLKRTAIASLLSRKKQEHATSPYTRGVKRTIDQVKSEPE